LALLQGFVSANKTQQDLKGFDCGEASMNNFLSRSACRDMGLGISTTWVLPSGAVTEGKKIPVAAYYTLSSATVTRDQVPTEKSHPPYSLPVVLLAKLAIDVNHQRKGLGSKVLVETLRHSAILTDRGLPAIGLILDVLNDEALAFYQKFDLFEPCTDDPRRLFVPMNVLKQI